MKPTIVSVIQNIIDSKSTSVGEVVSNLYGSSVVIEPTQETHGRQGTWAILHIPVQDQQYGPSTLIRLYNELDVPVVQANNGVLTQTSEAGTTLFTTVVSLPYSTGIRVLVTSNNKQISVYVNDTVYKRSFGTLSTTINLPAGLSSLNIITQGDTPNDVSIELPSDVSFGIESYTPSTPVWLASGSINAGYIDPITGTNGINLKWYNQSDASSWNVYRVDKTFWGIISGSTTTGGIHYITIFHSGIGPPIGSIAIVDSGIVGTIVQSTGDAIFSCISVMPSSSAEPIIYSGSLYIYNIRSIGNVSRLAATESVEFIDSNVQKGTRYYYTIDASSVYNPAIKSDKAPVVSAVAGDVYPPGNITLHGISILDDYFSIQYTPPADTDYLGTRVVHYYMGSGTGQIANTLIHTDFGLPSIRDSMVFQGPASGTYYFLTFDQLYNTQYIFSGVPYYWNGSGTSNFLTNQRPTIAIAQLSSSEVTANGHNPQVIAGYRLTGSDIESPGSLQVHYIINSGIAAGWVTAPSNPYTVYIGVQNRDAILRARAFDGELYSDELMTSVDADSSPEISSIFDRYVVASGAVFITGAVDDDAQSLKWYISAGGDPGDPTASSPTSINNLGSTKTFAFSFNLSDGQRKTLQIIPYGNSDGTGTTGLLYSNEFIRPPRTIATLKERALGGSVTRTSVGVTLSPIPDTAITYEKVYPIEYSTVTSGISTTITDNTANWVTDMWATNYDANIVEGVGINQSRQIVSNGPKTLVISPAWSVTPTSSSKYEIRERFRLHNDIGTATSGNANYLVDSTKTGVWITNGFEGKSLLIYSGTGSGQLTTIVSGTATILSVSPAFNPFPNATSGYKIYGERTITRDVSRPVFMQFYSYERRSNLAEEAQTIVVDEDNMPSIGSGSFTQYNSAQAQVAILNLDEDIKFWGLWAKKGSWPTLDSGVATSGLDDTYRIYYGDTRTTSLTFNAGQGWWYTIAVPYDSYGNVGMPLLLSGQIVVGTPPAQIPALTSVSVGTVPGNNNYNKIRWYHNSACDKPGGSDGTVTVRIWAYRSDLGPATESEITEPTTRYAWQDSEKGDPTANTDDGSTDQISGYGSMTHLVLKGGKFDPYITWYYTIKLYDGAILRNVYEVERSDNINPIDPI